jgi:pimeloyl-ACP methyl ester carboxylesterase
MIQEDCVTPEPISSEKSTTVRLRPVPVPAPIRLAFRLGGAIAPAWTAAAGRRLFFTPPRSRRRPDQEAVMARGRRFDYTTSEGRIAGWSWGDGEPVLLLHGWGGNAGQLTPFVEPLATRGFSPVALDLPAHGEAEGRMASLRHFGGAILDVAASLGPLAGVVAHSFGGAAATFAMERGLTVRSAVFLAPPSRFESFFARVSAGLGLSAPMRRRLETLCEQWVGLCLAEVEPRRLAPRREEPLLVVHDRGDDEVLFAEGAELAGLWPAARLLPTAGLGHYRLLREPEVIESVVEFLATATDADQGSTLGGIAAMR